MLLFKIGAAEALRDNIGNTLGNKVRYIAAKACNLLYHAGA